MSLSRIGKLVAEKARVSSFEETFARRLHDVDLFLPSRATPKVSALAHAVSALVVRCFSGRIALHAEDPSALDPSPFAGGLRDRLSRLSKEYDGEDRLVDGRPRGAASVRLAIACSVSGAVRVDASGARAGVNTALPGDDALGFACAFAASCGVAKAFASAVLGDDSFADEAWQLSLADFSSGTAVDPPAAPPLELGVIGLLGAGAVGSAFLYALWLSGVTADIHVLDRDRYEEQNCETTMFLGRREAARRGAKAAVLARLAATSRLRVRGGLVEVRSGDRALAEPRDVFVCAADNAEVRRELDAVNARVLLNGATGGTKESAGHVLCTSHGHGEPPLSTLYPPRAAGDSAGDAEDVPQLADITDECSRFAYREASLAAPFISLATGSLLAARCAAHAAGRTLPGYLKIDMLGRQSAAQSIEWRR